MTKRWTMLPTDEAPTDREWTDAEWVRNQWWIASQRASEAERDVARLEAALREAREDLAQYRYMEAESLRAAEAIRQSDMLPDWMWPAAKERAWFLGAEAALATLRELMLEAADWINNYHGVHAPDVASCGGCVMERRLRRAAAGEG